VVEENAKDNEARESLKEAEHDLEESRKEHEEVTEDEARGHKGSDTGNDREMVEEHTIDHEEVANSHGDSKPTSTEQDVANGNADEDVVEKSAKDAKDGDDTKEHEDEEHGLLGLRKKLVAKGGDLLSNVKALIPDKEAVAE
jgi:hypothetical protein